MSASTINSKDLATLPVNLRLKDILKTLPRECFQKNARKAWQSLLFNIFLVALCYWGLAISPWFLLPVLWIVTGTALTGFFVIAHDCGHRSFANRRWVNDLVGHLMLLPLLYPFHGWRIQHNIHHIHTNKLDLDTAWHPITPEMYSSSQLVEQWLNRRVRSWFWWIGSLGHWALMHFNWSQFPAKYAPQMKLSVAVVVVFASIAFPILIATVGVWGVVKFWLMPWLVYHFWMSTFTLIHHTAPDIPFHSADRWDAACAQLSGTVHCDYPTWVEYVCHHINVHIPHHISTAIPSYNLRMAHTSIKQNWGSYIYECQFSWSLLKKIASQCHLYHSENCYQTFNNYLGNR